MTDQQTYLVVTTYADEIPLHAGGLIANATRLGHDVHILVLCHPGYPPKILYPEVNEKNPYGPFKTLQAWEEKHAQPELEKVLFALGVSKCVKWPYSANLHQLFEMQVVERMTHLLNEIQPDIVVTHWPISDYTDFMGAGTLVMRSMIEQRLNKMPAVYFSETLTGRHSLCFKPDLYIDISEVIEVKREACSALWQGRNLDLFFNPHALPIAQFRGRECGVAFAEAYTALHGFFGIEKRPLIGSLPGYRAQTISTAHSLLPQSTVRDGKRLHPIASVPNEAAKLVYGI